MAAFLDALGIEQIPVVGASGGGPSTYLLAARHPERVRCLVEIDSICITYPKPSWLATRLTYSPTSLRLTQVLVDRYPRGGTKALLGAAAPWMRRPGPAKLSELPATPTASPC